MSTPWYFWWGTAEVWKRSHVQRDLEALSTRTHRFEQKRHRDHGADRDTAAKQRTQIIAK